MFVAVAIAMLILGYVGLEEHVPKSGHGTRALDLLYWDVQLFVLDSAPVNEGGDLPLTLQIARFGAPATTGYALLTAASVILGRQIAVARARHARGHTVICGTEPAMIFLARELPRPKTRRRDHRARGHSRCCGPGLAGRRGASRR